MGFHSLKADKLPSTGKPGDVYYVAPRTVYLAAADGVLVNLTDILTTGAEVPRAVGPMGERGFPGTPGENGKDGQPGPRGPQGERGETGPRGESGKDGRDGKQGDKGDQGVPGRDGKITVDLTPEHLAKIDDIQFKLDALLEKDAKGTRYIAWLQSEISSSTKPQ